MPMPSEARRVRHGVQGTTMTKPIANNPPEIDPPGEAPSGQTTATIAVEQRLRKTVERIGSEDPDDVLGSHCNAEVLVLERTGALDLEQGQELVERVAAMLEIDNFFALVHEDQRPAARRGDECLCDPAGTGPAPCRRIAGERPGAITIPIAGLSAEQRHGVLETMLAEVAGRAGLSITLANLEALAPIGSLGLRRCRLAFEIAIASAVEQDRRFLRRQDLEVAVALLGAGRERLPIGFMRPGKSDDH